MPETQRRVQGKRVLMDVSATGEENIIEEDDEMRDLEYRRKQLERLQTEVVDLEDVSGGISITDLTFNDFKTDLMEYMKDHRQELDKAPTGMYAVAAIDDSLKDTVKPGVIFTLRQIKGAQDAQEQNALFPHYMIYIANDGEVKLSFLNVKRELDIFKKLCCGQKEVLAELVQSFNQETDGGKNMKQYSSLLEKAIASLTGKKQEVGVASLFRKGGTTLQKEYYDGVEDFELVTFLVLK